MTVTSLKYWVKNNGFSSGNRHKSEHIHSQSTHLVLRKKKIQLKLA